MLNFIEIGRTVVVMRERKGLTQEKLALEAEMSVTYLRRIELSTLLQLSEGGQKSREESRALCDGEEARHA